MKTRIWYYYGHNYGLNTFTAGVATTEAEARRNAAEWCDKYEIDSKILDVTEKEKP